MSVLLASPFDPPDRPDDEIYPAALNRLALAGIFVFGAIAALALFALPTLTGMGLSFFEAFWTIAAVEFVAAVGAGASVYWLYGNPDTTPDEADEE